MSTNTYHTALGAHHAQMTVQHGQHSLEHHAYPPEPEAAYEAVQQEEQAAVEVEAEAETEPPADMSLTDNRGESLAEKRKRLGRCNPLAVLLQPNRRACCTGPASLVCI